MKWKDKFKQNKWYANMYSYEVVFEELEDLLFVITIYPSEAKK